MRTLPAPIHRLLRDRRGVGAIEFALVVPLLLIVYIGGVDVTRAIIFSHKMQNATVAVNDLVTQSSKLTKSDVEKTFDAADAMLAKYRAGDLNIRVTSVRIDSEGNAKVQWSVARGMTRTGANSSYAMPERLAGLRDFTLVVTESEHSFLPFFSYVLEAAIPLSAKAQGRFRGRNLVDCKDCTS